MLELTFKLLVTYRSSMLLELLLLAPDNVNNTSPISLVVKAENLNKKLGKIRAFCVRGRIIY